MNYFERKVFKNWGTVYQAWSSSLTNIKPKYVMYHLHKPSVTPPLPAPFYPLLIIFLSYSWFSIPYLFAYNCYDNSAATIYVMAILQYTAFVLLRTIWFTLRFFVGSILQRCKCIRVFHGIYNKPPQVLCQCYQLLSNTKNVNLAKAKSEIKW